jgi:hypothetical protein
MLTRSLTTRVRPLSRLAGLAFAALHGGRFSGGGMLSRAVLAFIAAAWALLIHGDATRLMQAELTRSDLWPRAGALRRLGVGVATQTDDVGSWRGDFLRAKVPEPGEHSLIRTNFPRSCLHRREQGYRTKDTISEKMLDGLLMDDSRTRKQPALFRPGR